MNPGPPAVRRTAEVRTGERTGVGTEPEFDAWLERVRATYQAVRFTCAHRLHDAELAGAAAVQVVAGLVSRPQVFRYFGLPYSGRIARLAEARIAEAAAGELAAACSWEELWQGLRSLPAEHREVLVRSCVRGEDLDALAEGLDCGPDAAECRLAAMAAAMRAVAGPGLPGGPDPGEGR